MLWDRQGGESYPAFEAFKLFLTKRSYPKVAEELSKSTTHLPPKFMPALIEAIKAGSNLERTARELKQTKPQENLFVETLTQIWNGRCDGE